MSIQYQTRSDGNGPYSGLHHFKTLQQAYSAWEQDPQIEKISWYINGVNNRFRPKYKKDLWNPFSEAKMCLLSKDYLEAKPEDLFWVQQEILTPNIQILIKKKKEENLNKAEFEQLCLAEQILAVYTPDQFFQKYN